MQHSYHHESAVQNYHVEFKKLYMEPLPSELRHVTHIDEDGMLRFKTSQAE